MPVFVLLLRGVNVGRARRVPMADLRALLGDLGHRRVATLLNSGNAVFHAARGGAAAHGQAIGAAIAERFGFEVPLVVKAAADLDRIVAANPLHFDVEAHARVLVVFANSAAALRELAPIGSLVEAPEAFHVGAHAAFQHFALVPDERPGIGKPLAAVVAGEDNDGVVGDAEFIQLVQQFPDNPVELLHAIGEEAQSGLVRPAL